MSLEALVVNSINHFFPGVSFNSNAHVGGDSCRNKIMGNCERVKAAYIDVVIITSKQRINIEVDENCHHYYNQSCELQRYDTMLFGGKEEMKKQWVLRSNPNEQVDIQLSLV